MPLFSFAVPQVRVKAPQSFFKLVEKLEPPQTNKHTTRNKAKKSGEFSQI